jgi:hypothetical protein
MIKNWVKFNESSTVYERINQIERKDIIDIITSGRDMNDYLYNVCDDVGLSNKFYHSLQYVTGGGSGMIEEDF